MPNWCNCNVSITSTPEEVERIAEALQDATSKNYLGDEPFTFKEEWLGNLLCYTGKTADEVSNGDICCRGSITYWEKISDTQISMCLETAWSPQFGAFPPFFNYLGVHPEVIYTAEEYGNLLFVTNDPVVADTYILYDRAMCETYYDLTESDLHKMLIDEYDMDEREGESMPDLISRAEDERDISVYQYEYEDLDAWVV